MYFAYEEVRKVLHLSSALNEFYWKTVGSRRKPRSVCSVPMNVLQRSKSKLWKNEIAMNNICLYPRGTTD